jgi:TPR repeat protein
VRRIKTDCKSLFNISGSSLIVLVATGLVFTLAEPAGASPNSGEQIQAKAEVPEAPPRSARELTRMGDNSFEGKGVAQDYRLAAQYYAEASLLGEPRAMMRFGEALVLGRGTAVDIPRGVSLLRMSADKGNSSAALILAELYAQGTIDGADGAQSIAFYERAAELGRDMALVKLAQIYSQGIIVPADAQRAVSYYRKAVKAGRKDAMLALGVAMAERKFGRVGKRAEGYALLKEASRLGQPDAVVFMADCHFSGHGVPRNPDMAIRILRQAWDEGNVKAGLKLLSIYRDGRKNAVKKNDFLANYYFRRVSHALTAEEVAFESVLLKASRASARQQYENIRQEIGDMSDKSRPIAVRKMRITNPNAYVYLVQARLGALNVYNGRPTGLLTSKTTRAIHKYCLARSKADVCRKGPLTSEVASAISEAF